MSSIDTSNIDPLIPTSGFATTASVRANFAEIIAQLINAGVDIDAVVAALAAHEADFDNPHQVTAEQVGASPSTHTHAVFTDIANGFVPLTGAGTGLRVLQEDGTWVDQTGGAGDGDMLKSVYDTIDSGRVDRAESMGDAGGNVTTAVGVYDHLASTLNPHSVTAVQVGALPASGGHVTGGFTTDIPDAGLVLLGGILTPNILLSQMQTFTVQGVFSIAEPAASGSIEYYFSSLGGTLTGETGVTIIGEPTMTSGVDYLLTVKRYGAGKTIAQLIAVS